MSTNSPELLIELDRSRPRGLRAQVEDQLRETIRQGRLKPGTHLPSSRALATDLQVTRGVVVAAYDQLAAEGYVTTRQGSGTVVNAVSAPATAKRQVTSGPKIRYDFRPGTPDVGLFPRAAWVRATRAALGSLPDSALDYGDPCGLPQLRKSLAGYLGRVRGVSCEPDHVVVCNGFSHGLSLVTQVLAARGCASFAVEDPGQVKRMGAQAALVGAGIRPVAVDDHGLCVDELAGSSAGAVLTTPAHQHPTGVLLSAHRRTELVAWARTSGGYVIEDDYDAEYRYDREPVGALQGVAPDHVIYAGTVSKSLAPGLRLGWLVVPNALRDDIVAVRDATDMFTTTIVQATVAELLDRGDLDRHLRRTRRVYRQRRDTLVEALETQIPGSRATGIAAGLHMVVRLPDGIDAGRVAAAAAQNGVAVRPLDYYRLVATATEPTALVVSYGALNPRQIRDGINLLARSIDPA